MSACARRALHQPLTRLRWMVLSAGPRNPYRQGRSMFLSGNCGPSCQLLRRLSLREPLGAPAEVLPGCLHSHLFYYWAQSGETGLGKGPLATSQAALKRQPGQPDEQLSVSKTGTVGLPRGLSSEYVTTAWPRDMATECVGLPTSSGLILLLSRGR